MKNLFVTLLLLVSVVGLADTQEKLRADKFQLNQANPQAMLKSQLGERVIDKAVHVLRAVYDFSVVGGAISTLSLKDASNPSQNAVLPKGAIVRDCLIDTIVTPVSGGSTTVALGTGQAADDLKAATAKASYTGLMACVPVGSAATAIKLTADRTMSATIATAAITSGKFYVIVHYELSTTD